MNLLSLIIIALALVIVGSVFFIAWELSSDKPPKGAQSNGDKKEPDESKES